MKVLVVGAASGLGKAVAAQAAARSDRVCTIDVDTHVVGDVDGVVASVACDISDASAIEQALETLEREAPFDLVVISAGISATGPFEDIDPALMSRVISVNLTGTMMMTAALLKRSMIARAGRLVLVSSLSQFVSYPGASAYAASKEGVAVFARSIGRGLRRERDITVQVVAPGPMDTPHAERHAPRGAREGTGCIPIWLRESSFATAVAQ